MFKLNITGNPRLYQLEILANIKQAKTLAFIALTKTSSEEGALNVFGVSAKLNELTINDHVGKHIFSISKSR